MNCKMTKDEIKKALKCCGDWNGCNNCPYYYAQEGEDCVDGQISRDALQLINAQEAEIERLNGGNTREELNAINMNDELMRLLNEQSVKLEEAVAENKKLTEIVDSKVYGFVENIIDNGKARAEIEKQAKIGVLERLKERLDGYYPSFMSEIDELIEEVKAE